MTHWRDDKLTLGKLFGLVGIGLVLWICVILGAQWLVELITR